jgi:exodeoxyribonuclease VII large subunit
MIYDPDLNMSDKLSLTELQLIIRDSLYLSLPQSFWVAAEISEFTVNTAGHCYLELVEKHPDEKNIRARIRGIIWGSRFGFIRSFFENITGETLKTGLKILVRAKVEYHELYGLSLVISDIDPAFTLGDMAVKRQLIIKRLEEEGVFSMNREIEFPLLPQKIAVISSKNAAGYTDFLNHLTLNSYGYVFYTALIDTPMQGTETEQGVITALDKVAEHADLFDIVVIIRGGGSQTDLSWFDSYAIAYYVTQFPLPVVTGIGHEKNLSVTDLVANTSLKTPTAVADFLIDRMAGAENELNELCSRIRDTSKAIIEENKNNIGAYSLKLLPSARIMIAETKEMLSGKIMKLIALGRAKTFRSEVLTSNLISRLFSTVKTSSSERIRSMETLRQSLISGTLNAINNHRIRLSGLDSALNMLNPENVLKRGYTITSLNGKILKSSKELKKDDNIDTFFADGAVSSKVVERSQTGEGSDLKIK